MNYIIDFAELKRVCKYRIWILDHQSNPIRVCNKKDIPDGENWACCDEASCPIVAEWTKDIDGD